MSTYRIDDAAAQNVDPISGVHSASGQYDLMMKCYLPDGADISHFATEKIQRLPGVKDNFTIIPFKAFG